MLIQVNALSDSYDIVLERGALEKAGEYLALDRRVFIVTDSGVPSEYASALYRRCGCAHIHCIPEGEKSKSFAELQGILSNMLAFGMTRADCVIAVGGGVVGDLAGFAASCYMRGLDFYNIPTTLLAQVDSSVGGKTAIDLDGVKNAVGAFYQPKKVLIDPDTLKTLAPRQLHAGLAECIKMAATSDAELFGMIERHRIQEDIEKIISRSLAVKTAVVERDVRENGLRKVLNFGHTLGHAIESAAGGRLLHGECVALGMLPMCSENVRRRLIPLLESYRLPTGTPLDEKQILTYIAHDKKMQGEYIDTVYVDKIGSFVFRKMSLEDIGRCFMEKIKVTSEYLEVP